MTHQILIEQLHRDNFAQYFSRLEAGEDESAAFSESFPISHEDLDKELRAALARGVLKVGIIKVTEEPDQTEPRALSVSESKGRLARFAVLHGVDAGGGKALALESLALDPKN